MFIRIFFVPERTHFKFSKEGRRFILHVLNKVFIRMLKYVHHKIEDERVQKKDKLKGGKAVLFCMYSIKF